MRRLKKVLATAMVLFITLSLSGCSTVGSGKRIIRIAHGQSETHPENLGLIAFKDTIEKELGDTFEVEIFPNEILGSSQKAIELTQTGAIDFVVSASANIETFANIFEVFSMPYLFDSEEAYYSVMGDKEFMDSIYESTDKAGFRVLTWFSAGTRNLYGKKEIKTPDDLAGLKIRVQQSPASVGLLNAFGAAASPMSFGEVYTAIQQGVIDGAENNELALTNNKHGEVCKYFSYDKHQMVPDLMIGNLKLLNSLSPKEREVFEKAAAHATEVELVEWDKQTKESIRIAKEEMKVNFIDVDIQAFKNKVLPFQETMMKKNPQIRRIYDHVQTVNKDVAAKNESVQ